MREVEGKVAFITGGASGIGFAMARTFLNAGMKVAIADFSDSNLDDARDQLAGDNRDYMTVKLDVRDRTAFALVADEVEAHFGKLHVVCNNAGIGMAELISRAGYADWDEMMDINLGGVINGVVTLLPRIRRHGEGGHIVNTSSMAGILPLPDAGGIYTAGKFAVRGMTESLRLALVPDRIGVSCLFPGLTKTRILDKAKEQVASAAGDIDPVSAGFAVAQENAMDPMDLAGAVLDAIRNNDPYIIGHAEFVDELEEQHRELMAAIRRDLPMDPRRAEFENGRREGIREIKAQMQAW
jgi:NAD(P)-dependent dehydrogenase (short-subunit alcohol dehydrogenase family)